VKYYNNEDFEINRYKSAILTYQEATRRMSYLTNGASILQAFVILGGSILGCILCAYFIIAHLNGMTVGDYVLYLTYSQQLYGPLSQLSMNYA
jgi:ATP-binding cassette subfamily B (MDR/TAP) protein 6